MNLLKELIPESNKVLAGFSMAANKYDSYAKHHKLITSVMVQQLAKLNISPKKLLELGCGSGILSEGLVNLFPEAKKVFSDGSEEMLSFCKQKAGSSNLHEFRKINFNKTIRNINTDLIVSSCSLQWLTNPLYFTQNLSKVLLKNGFTAHAIPVKGMLYELHNSFELTNSHWNSLMYKTGEEWNKLFEKCGFKIITSFTESFTISYASSLDVLKAIRGIGASLSTHTNSVSVPATNLRKALNFYQAKYSDQLDTNAVPATYNILFLIAKLKEKTR